MQLITFITKLLPFIREIININYIKRIITSENRVILYLTVSLFGMFVLFSSMSEQAFNQAKQKFDIKQQNDLLQTRIEKLEETISLYQKYLKEEENTHEESKAHDKQ